MRRKLTVLLAAAMMTLGVALPAPAATSSDFAGLWTSTDAADGSQQLMLIVPRGETDTRVILFDRNATVACGDGIAAIAHGRGEVSGDEMIVEFRIRCLGRAPSTSATITFTLLSDGTLTDNGSPGTIWNQR